MVAAVSPAYAAPVAAKLVPALVAAAKKELDAGNFDRAGELYLQIWQQDASLLVALNNAGRAYQMAGRLEKADELYGLYLKQPHAEAAGIAKVRAYQAELQVARGDLKVEGAARAESEGKYALAA
jgi:tetratricopeptide (TPR) repeat protein